MPTSAAAVEPDWVWIAALAGSVWTTPEAGWTDTGAGTTVCRLTGVASAGLAPTSQAVEMATATAEASKA
ncbi:hypothetical protein Cs7R123_05920 [Catellatospora sp. TT07R-123]|nr:hypothetical protein Cs7R123_05920 [Catellatospora sp. TT07R-123]